MFFALSVVRIATRVVGGTYREQIVHSCSLLQGMKILKLECFFIQIKDFSYVEGCMKTAEKQKLGLGSRENQDFNTVRYNTGLQSRIDL